MPNPRPRVGDIWRFKFNGLGMEFYYLIVEETECDPNTYHADSVTLLSFTESEAPYTKEPLSKLAADTKRWNFIV